MLSYRCRISFASVVILRCCWAAKRSGSKGSWRLPTSLLSFPPFPRTGPSQGTATAPSLPSITRCSSRPTLRYYWTATALLPD